MPLYIEPHAGVSPIIQVIQSARHEVNAGVYYLADRAILDALKAAHARGVDVRIIIEEKPYGIRPWMVHKEETAIKATGATLYLAPYRFTSHGPAGGESGHYAFQHSKYIRRSNHWGHQPARTDELLPPSLYGYGVSFVLHRGETSTAPHLGRFPPGAGTTGQSHFKPPQQDQSRIFVAATGDAAMRALVFPVRERFLLIW